jgi:hypothetical protein
MGLPYSAAHTVLPFMLLGIGIGKDSSSRIWIIQLQYLYNYLINNSNKKSVDNEFFKSMIF